MWRSHGQENSCLSHTHTIMKSLKCFYVEIELQDCLQDKTIEIVLNRLKNSNTVNVDSELFDSSTDLND